MDYIAFKLEYMICCKGSSGGGGSASGKVDFPTHMKEAHKDALNDNGSDKPLLSMVDLLNSNFTSDNPYTSIQLYNPDTSLNPVDVKTALLYNAAEAMDTTMATQLPAAVALIDTNLVNEATITAQLEAYAAILTDDYEQQVLPVFEIGMNDIGAVMSSAFVLGRAHILAQRDKQYNLYATELRHKYHLLRFTESLALANKIVENMLNTHSQIRSTYAHGVEVARIRIAAEHDYTNQEKDLTFAEETWFYELFMYYGNFLGAMGGGTYVPQKPDTNSPSALGGALSGAAAGAMATGGNPWGIAAGAALGLGSALL